MKKLLWLIVCLMTMVVSLTSCGSTYMATANYDVCYPDGTRNFDGTAVVVSSTKPSVICYSFQGTNYVSVVKTDITITSTNVNGIPVMHSDNMKKAEHIASSTAPMRLNSYSIEKVKKAKPKSQWDLW